MERVLIATLGESPIVVSGMVTVLQHQVDVTLDKVQIVYPDEPNERWIFRGYEFLEACLQQSLAVEPIPLPFDDARTEAHSLDFLRLLNGYLQAHEAVGNQVYLSLAGGRKHTSTLMAVLPQFYPCVQGLYHLHDIEANNPRRQFTIPQLERMTETERQQRLRPPAERFRLVALPCQHLTQAVTLQQWLKQKETADNPPPIPISPAAESFYGELFRDPATGDPSRLTVWLTETAYNQYCALFEQGSTHIPVLNAYLRDMAKASWLQIPQHIHDHETDPNPAHVQEGSDTPLNHFTCKKNRTAERVFYYTQPHAITAKNRPVNRVIVTRFPVHITASEYDISLQDWIKQADTVPRYRLADLPVQRVILIASLGETPMVVTQAFTLMQSSQHLEPPVQVSAIHVVYPGHYTPARNSARTLQSVCTRRGIDLHLYPLPMEDLDTRESVDCFIAGLKQAITTVRQQEVEANIALLLAGGRKGMSALAFYVAQTEGILQVYHTTIHDPVREREIEERTSYDTLRSLPAAQQAELLFLESFEATDFTLITVPVLALSLGQP